MDDDLLKILDDKTTTANSALLLREGRRAFVDLDRDHPGFRDPDYRARRNAIAQIAVDYEPGAKVPHAPYSDEEHGVWATICENLEPEHQRSACAEYVRYARELAMPRDRIPQLEEVNARITQISGFRLEPVGGLVHPKVFLSAMANGVFLCTQYIRHHSTPSYTPEPDVVHELIGHAAQLASPRFAALNRAFGKRATSLADGDALTRLSRVYWYTLEFGVLSEGGELKAFGSGLLSSYGEMQAMRRAEIRPMDIEAMETTAYNPTDFQPLLFRADSFEHLETVLGAYLAT
ncbi:MAG: phenylalanine 4-monooxygenase [Myxococcales bacterium]|nr:phenylalanine 4-monooxygenase [Myxococcales bacterium]